jgi:drug/metabolite transporter (DMT)-like permease
VHASRDRLTLAAFLGSVLMGGGNSIGIRLTISDLPPFWGATLRFGLAGLALAIVVIAMRRSLPRGRQLLGAVLYGIFNFGLAFVFIYLGLRDAPASTAQVAMATVPLTTLLLAVAQRVEPFRLYGLLGSLIAGLGVAVLFADRADFTAPIPSLLAILLGGACMAEANVLAKRFPPGDPLAANTVAMLCGATLLLAATARSGETASLPRQTETWLVLGYMVVFGSMGVFILALHVLSRWTASAISYAFLLLPLVTVPEAAVLLHEPVKPIFVLASVLVFAGVYLGAFYRPRPSASPAGERRRGPAGPSAEAREPLG